MKLSIIIPVYNSEAYLEKCLDSIVAQQLPANEFEVILINDGSTDNSLKILESYAAKCPNFKVFTQANSGEAKTRNFGLSVANGDYIGFIDSDDYIDANSLHKIVKRIFDEHLDILYCQMKKIATDGSSLGFISECGKDNVVLRGVEHERRPFPATFYKKSLIGNDLFPTGILIGPDSVFNAIIQSKTQRVSYCSEPYYNYLIRPDSLSKKGQTEAAYEGFMKAIDVLNSRKTERKNDQAWNLYFENIIFVFITRIVENNILPELDKARYKALSDKLQKYNISHLLARLSDKYPFIGKDENKFFNYQRKLIIKSKLYKFIASLTQSKK